MKDRSPASSAMAKSGGNCCGGLLAGLFIQVKDLRPLPALIWTGLTFTISFAALAWNFRLLTNAEKKRVVELAQRWGAWFTRGRAQRVEVP